MKKLLSFLLLGFLFTTAVACRASSQSLPNATIVNDTSIYANNTANGRVIAAIEKNARVEIQSQTSDGQWYYISSQKASGWVKQQDISLDADARIKTLPTSPPPKPDPTITIRPTIRATAPSSAGSSHPSGTSGKCRDGTYTRADNRQGACSHHGGVASWWGK